MFPFKWEISHRWKFWFSTEVWFFSKLSKHRNSFINIFRGKYWRKEQKNERKARRGWKKIYLCISELNLLVVAVFCLFHFEISNVSICSWLKREVDCFTLMWIPVRFPNVYQVLPTKKYNLHVGHWETQSCINIEWVHENPDSSRIWSLFRLKAL